MKSRRTKPSESAVRPPTRSSSQGLESGRFDDTLANFIDGISDEDLAWQMTDHLVQNAQNAFHDVWQQTKGDNGWVSFELDPLLEDVDNPTPHDEAVARYIELGKQWSAGHDNRMIKVPATEAGLAALEELAAAGITLNVTLIFSERQYLAARDAIWRGRQRFGQLDSFKSVYWIFISRVDVYTQKQLPDLSDGPRAKSASSTPSRSVSPTKPSGRTRAWP